MNQLNECMYCGSLESLTDEHIIPFGMGGDLVFQKSSCKDCAKKTSKDERKVLRGFMYDGRLIGNMPSRRKKNVVRSRRGCIGIQGDLRGAVD